MQLGRIALSEIGRKPSHLQVAVPLLSHKAVSQSVLPRHPPPLRLEIPGRRRNLFLNLVWLSSVEARLLNPHGLPGSVAARIVKFVCYTPTPRTAAICHHGEHGGTGGGGFGLRASAAALGACSHPGGHEPGSERRLAVFAVRKGSSSYRRCAGRNR